MPNPNQVQAVNLLRRLRANPARQEAQKAAQALVEKVQGVALALTSQAVLQIAIARHPDETISDALALLDLEVDHSREQSRQLQAVFADAIKSEEQRLAPFDAACAKRGDEIQKLLEAAHLDYRSKIKHQDAAERRYKIYTNKGLLRHEIAALGIPAPVNRSDEEKRNERNAWGCELEQFTQALTSERDAILDFKRTRNENALPATVLALLEGEK
jgi:hypothetical protein